MTPERWAQVRKLFEETIEKPPKQRAAFLLQACNSDNDLRYEVEALLASHDSATDFLEKPAVQLGQALMSPAAPASAQEDWVGRTLGPYRLERRLGMGGMGSVWLATRSDPEFTKRVAIKMVRAGMDSQEILRRFRLERQLLASLEHPNIAHLIDGGSTPEGLPFLVMEYVEGTPISQYCESRAISITDRLRLFRSVCSAVQYAHQNLIVHRDIKASNIMVTSAGTAKLLDFGIAKVLGSDDTSVLSHTRPGMRPMTLDYASPEQVSGEPMTTATDIYSLGVLLYRILTGMLPYGNDGRDPSSLIDAIRSKEPIRPSAVVLSTQELQVPQATQVMEARTESRENARRRLQKKLSGDLDAIILKTLSKRPVDRYVSAEALSEDLRRYLEGLPVHARLRSPGYRLGKFVRRNIWGVVAATVLGTALVAGVIYYGARANRGASKLTAAEQSLMDTRRQLMHSEIALGDAQLAQKNYDAAYASFNRSLDIAQDFARHETAANRQPLPDTRLALADGNASLGRVLVTTGPTRDAISRLQRAQQMYRDFLASEPQNTQAQRGLSFVTDALAQATGLPRN